MTQGRTDWHAMRRYDRTATEAGAGLPIGRRTLLAGAATMLAGAPVGRATAQARQPRVGLLGSASPETFRTPLLGFTEGLAQAGFVDGQTVTVAARWAEGRFDRLPALAAELVALGVDVIFTVGGNVAALAARGATDRIPIVFLTGDDPVATGLVRSLGQPGGGLTGVTWLAAALGVKNLELIDEALPAARTIGALFNPARPTFAAQQSGIAAAVAGQGKVLRPFLIGGPEDLDAAFAAAGAEGVQALLVTIDALFIFHRDRLVALAARHRIPTVYFQREFVEIGGLMSYGARERDAARICGDQVARILRGGRPAELPVQQVTRIELVINQRTARALGVEIPLSVLSRADDVIE